MTVASPFQPKKGANQKVTATTTSATIGIGVGNKSLRVANAGSVVGYFRTFKLADGAETASAADTPVLPASAASSTLVIEKPQDHDTVAYVSDSATTTLHFQSGEGGS